MRIDNDPVRWGHFSALGECVWDSRYPTPRLVNYGVRPLIDASVDMAAMRVGWRLLCAVERKAGIVFAWRALQLLRAIDDPAHLADKWDEWIHGRPSLKHGPTHEKTRC